MNKPIDRRTFLAGAGASGLALTAVPGAQLFAKRALPPGSPVPRTLEQAMRGHVFERGSPGFNAAALVYNERFDGVSPRAVARPLDAKDVQGAVRWAVAHNVPLRARSGGHSYAGYSTLNDGVVLDLRKLNAISVDKRTGIATVGAGAQLIDVYAGLAARGATIPSGSCPSVGITGVTLGGGMGLAARAFGLTLDNLVGAEIVTADGLIRQVDRHHDADLLWALRGGGGGNFGVVTKLHFRVHKLPKSASWFIVTWPWSSAGDALDAWQHWAPHARDQLTSVLHLQKGLHGPEVLVAGQHLGRFSELGGLLAPLTGVAGGSMFGGDQAYLPLQMRWAACPGGSLSRCHTVGTSPGGTLMRDRFWAKSDYAAHPISAAGRQRLIAAIEHRQMLPGLRGSILFDSYGGAINRVAPDVTAFVHRNVLFAMQYLNYDTGAAWVRDTHAGMRPFVSGQAYQNYIDAELGGWQHAYYGANYHRLLQVRRRVDPDHRFNFPQAIGR
jgi:FAD/FMN-containing dehydrogenase